MHIYRKKAIIYLFVMMLLFFAAFIISYLNLKRGNSIVSIGLGYKAEDLIVIMLSFAAIVKIFLELIKIEHHNGHKTRAKGSY